MLDETNRERGIAGVDIGNVIRLPLIDVIHHELEALPDRREIALVVRLLEQPHLLEVDQGEHVLVPIGLQDLPLEVVQDLGLQAVADERVEAEESQDLEDGLLLVDQPLNVLDVLVVIHSGHKI